MRHLSKLIAIILYSSCMESSREATIVSLPEYLKFTTTTLRDSLGTVSFAIPARFDTSFTWTNRSDCGKPCDHEQYRYQPRTLPVFQESGFYFRIPDIPIDQFTIVHSGYFPFYNGDTSKLLGRHENFKSKLSTDIIYGTIVSDTIERIDDRYFSVVSLRGYNEEKKKHFAKVVALTTIKSNEIEFRYEMKSRDTITLRQFYESSIKFLRTISISNGI